MGKLAGKVAVVTGASKGIGAAIAKSYAAEGASVVVNYSSGKEGAEQVVAAITKAGGKAVAIKADIGKPDEIKRLFAETKKHFDKLDVVVNNAGVYKFEPLEAVSPEEFHRTFNINVLGAILVAQEAAKAFGSNGGSIINIGSVVSTAAIPNSVVYSSTKGAIDVVTRVLGAELAPRKIRVNTLAPGGTETEGTHTAGIVGGDFEKQLIAGTPMGRLGQPDDMAKVAVFFASDDSGWVTGERIAVAGGAR